MADHPVGDVAGHPRHPLLHGGRVDRDRLADLRVRADPALDVDVVVVALVADRLAAAGLLDDQPHRLDRLAQVRRRAAVLDPVPGLVEPLDAGAEAEPEAPARGLVDVERRERDDHRAAGERPGDPGADADRLGRGGQPHRLGERAAKELDRPDAVDPGRLGRARLLGEVGQGVAEAGDLDPVEGRRAAHPRATYLSSHSSEPYARASRPALRSAGGGPSTTPAGSASIWAMPALGRARGSPRPRARRRAGTPSARSPRTSASSAGTATSSATRRASRRSAGRGRSSRGRRRPPRSGRSVEWQIRSASAQELGPWRSAATRTGGVRLVAAVVAAAAGERARRVGRDR